MPAVTFYFQVHQPYRLKNYPVFSIGQDSAYFQSDEVRLNNQTILYKVATKCYLPANQILLDLIREYPEVRFTFSISGLALEQFMRYQPEVVDSFKALSRTGQVEFLTETYYHSLASIFSETEFKKQVKKHDQLIKEVLDFQPKVFRNTELIYNNDLANLVESMGYQGILAEGVDRYLGWRSPNYVYRPVQTKNLKLLLKNYRFSDDIAFRFSNQEWSEWPLTAEKFASWISDATGDTVNLFMDYETFGEHQWKDTGIFDFLKQLPAQVLANKKNSFKTVSETMKDFEAVDEVNMPELTSWADSERDVSAWLGNPLQKNANQAVYQLEQEVYATKDKDLIEDWRRLTTSDHFYYMSTKEAQDGEVHDYFSPNESVYEAFTNFMNILHDIRQRVYTEK